MRSVAAVGFRKGFPSNPLLKPWDYLFFDIGMCWDWREKMARCFLIGGKEPADLGTGEIRRL